MYRRYVRARDRCPTSYTVGSVDFCINELFKRPVFTDGQVSVLVLRAFARALIVISPLRRYLSLVTVYGFWIKKTSRRFSITAVGTGLSVCIETIEAKHEQWEMRDIVGVTTKTTRRQYWTIFKWYRPVDFEYNCYRKTRSCNIYRYQPSIVVQILRIVCGEIVFSRLWETIRKSVKTDAIIIKRFMTFNYTQQIFTKFTPTIVAHVSVFVRVFMSTYNYVISTRPTRLIDVSVVAILGNFTTDRCIYVL